MKEFNGAKKFWHASLRKLDTFTLAALVLGVGIAQKLQLGHCSGGPRSASAVARGLEKMTAGDFENG